MIKFILYDNENKIILALPDMPSNTDFENPRGDVWYENKKLIGGINWNNVNWDYTDTGLDLDFQTDKYLYNPTTNEVSLNPDWSEDEI